MSFKIEAVVVCWTWLLLIFLYSMDESTLLKNLAFQFGIEAFHQPQVNVLRAFFNGKHTYFSAPTGYGKSVVFQAVPRYFEELRPEISNPVLLVFSPLIALINDQIKAAGDSCIMAISLDKTVTDECYEDIKAGTYSLVYACPEVLETKRWRMLFSDSEFVDRCIGVVVDEAHVMVEWGKSSNESTKAFRESYSKIVELQSLLSSKARFMLFTATATSATQATIFSMLNLQSNDVYCEIYHPNKNNVRFTVEQISMGKEDGRYLVNFFDFIMEEIIAKKEHTCKTIIYVNTRKEVNLLNNGMASKLGVDLFLSGKEGNPRYRLVEEFHAYSPQSVKNHVLAQASILESHLRVIICTSAFGMGVNVKGFNRCIHFGPPSTVESFVQEVGRVGRDGSPSESILMFHKSLATHASSDMVEYAGSHVKCRRDFLMVKFPGTYSSLSNCTCCDLCSNVCQCKEPNCCKKLKQLNVNAQAPVTERRRNVSMAERDELRGLLNDFRMEIFNKKKNLKQVSLPNLFHEFTEYHVKQVMVNVTKIFNIQDLKSRVEIWRTRHAIEVLKIINSVFHDIEIDQMEQLNLEEEPLGLDDASFMNDT
uniref:DNA 3'-5' helicase n=1 Tax=Clytia hemisphaerica TaxID=252671 RepID=A0A7M5V0T6_9CNID